MLVVLSSPSGGGKTTVYRALLERHPDFMYSVSATTRPPRPNERNGVDYHFLSDEEFERRVEAGDFVEWAWVHGHRYGTLHATVKSALARGAVMLFDLDVQGAAAMKAAYPAQTITIFILPPSRKELARRLFARGTDSQEVIEVRLRNADEEVKRAHEYDYIVINDDLAACIDTVDCIIRSELCRPHRVLPIAGWEL